LAAGCKSKNRFVGAVPASPVPLVGQVFATGATVRWTTENPATTRVEFGTSEQYGNVLGNDEQMTASHSLALTSLTPATVYHYRINSRDSLGNVLFSFDKTFTTAASGVVLPLSGTVGFESGAEGWVHQTFSDSQAVSAVAAVASTVTHNGSSSLKLTLDLRGGHANLSQGETYVEFKNNNPAGVPMDFIDLSGRAVTAWIFAPSGARGDSSRPNGIQVFVKDAAGRSQYGPYVDITEQAWFSASITAGGSSNAFTSPGFDPSQAVIMGVKVGTGGGSAATYNGPIYVDDVVIQTN
jgi:hypothetical protein